MDYTRITSIPIKNDTSISGDSHRVSWKSVQIYPNRPKSTGIGEILDEHIHFVDLRCKNLSKYSKNAIKFSSFRKISGDFAGYPISYKLIFIQKFVYQYRWIIAVIYQLWKLVQVLTDLVGQILFTSVQSYVAHIFFTHFLSHEDFCTTFFILPIAIILSFADTVISRF
jgi:hypothetical protein